ncbi:MAG TPA: hypothetical protein VGL38_13300 [bacterium]|jgi:tRNA (Thr-GGU) A37 N-methylase
MLKGKRQKPKVDVQIDKRIVREAHTVVAVHGKFTEGTKQLGEFALVFVW